MIKYLFFGIILLSACILSGQEAIDLKGTRKAIDSSKWRLSGQDLFNKNSGNVGVGTSNPTAKFHTNGTVRLEGLLINNTQSRILNTDVNGNLSYRLFSNLLSAEFAGLPTGILKNTSGTGVLSIATASDFPILNQNTTGNAATVTTNANLTGPVRSIGNLTSIDANVVTNNMLTEVPTQTIKGRKSAGTGNVEDLTSTQLTSMLNTFTSNAQGLVPASGGVANTFLRSDGVFTTPTTNGGRQMTQTTTDISNSNPVGNTLEDVTGLSFNVVAGVTYRFYALIPYTATSTNNGSRWTINTPATSVLSYVSRNTLSANTETLTFSNSPNSPANCNNNSSLSGNIAVIEGIIRPTTNGTVQVRFASEVGGSPITVKTGASLEWW